MATSECKKNVGILSNLMEYVCDHLSRAVIDSQMLLSCASFGVGGGCISGLGVQPAANWKTEQERFVSALYNS